ncbi:MAG TPA: PqqD family peptide modification chaperone [Ktedonobacterales bacterium]|nr:PqqD family peptide modification chaperone [Ktedonobacterales bacterium]
MLIRRNGDWLSVAMGDERVMMSVQSGNYVTLSRVGARIWELLEKPTDAPALCARLSDEYNVGPETCRADVDVFLGELAAANAIIIEPSPA